MNITEAFKNLLNHAQGDVQFDAVLQAARVFAGKAEETGFGYWAGAEWVPDTLDGTFKLADGSTLFVELPELTRKRLAGEEARIFALAN